MILGKLDEIRRHLYDLTSIEGVSGALVASRDGLPLVGTFEEKEKMEMLSAMASTIVGAAETSISEVIGGALKTINVESTANYLLIIPLGSEALLVVIASINANLGFILLKINQVKEKIRKELSGGI